MFVLTVTTEENGAACKNKKKNNQVTNKPFIFPLSKQTKTNEARNILRVEECKLLQLRNMSEVNS